MSGSVRPGKRRISNFSRLTAWCRPLPDFVIIGAQKCGTSTLHAQLICHPQVRAGFRKEVSYFCQNYHRGLAWYRAHFPVTLARQRPWVTLDASPGYLFHPLAPARMATTLPNAKLIVLIRDPVARAYSHYQMSRRRGFEQMSFEAAIELEEERLGPELARMRAEPFYDSKVFRKQSYLARGRYAEQLERLFEQFPREQVRIICTEELQADPQAVHAGLYRFLDLESVQIPQIENRNVGSYEPMRALTRERLTSYFAPHNERLYELLGRDLGWPRPRREAPVPRTQNANQATVPLDRSTPVAHR